MSTNHDDGATRTDDLLQKAIDRKRLLGSAVLGAAGIGALLAPTGAFAAARRGMAPSRDNRLVRTGKTNTTFTFASSGSCQGFNPDKPATIASGPSMTMVIACYDSLTDVVIPNTTDGAKKAFAKGLPTTGKLAESWEVDKAGTTYRFHLRKGVKSHAGNTLTADDIKWSIDKAIAGKFVAAFLVALLNGVSDTSKQFKKIDDYTFDLVLNSPPPPYFLPIFGLPWVPIFDSKTAIAKGATDKDPYAQDWLNQNVAGFGPYKLDTFTPGQRVILTPHTGYWGGTPNLGRIVEQAVEDSSSRLQLVLAGQADYAEEMTAVQLDQVDKNPKTKVTQFASTRGVFLAVPNNVAPYNTAAFRKAMAQAIPYDDIIKTVFRGRAERWKTHIVPWFQGATDEFWKYDTDTAAAKAVLSAYGKPIQLSYITGVGPAQELAILIQKGFNDAGLKTELRALDLATANTAKATGTIGLWIDTTDSPAVPSVLYNMQLYYTTTAFQNNLSNYKNPEIDLWAKTLARNPDPKQQKKIIRIVQQKLMNDMPLIPIAYTGTVAATSKRIIGVQAHEIGLPYFQDISFLSAT